MKKRFGARSLLALCSTLALSGASQAALLVYYTFDTEDGTIVSNIGTEADGMIVGGGTYTPGQDASFGQAFLGNRIGDNDAHVTTELTGTDLGMGAGDVYTAMAWVNWAGSDPAAVTPDHMVFGQLDGDGNNPQLHHGIRDDGEVNIHFGGWGGPQDIADAGTVPVDTWTHVTWQYDGTDKVVYVDGEEITRAGGNNITAPELEVIIGGTGREGTPVTSFNGAIDEVKVFDSALSLERIQFHMAPAFLDSDGDELSDVEEVDVHNTDPNDDDSDNDGIADGEEVFNMLDPNSAEGDDGPDGDPDMDGLTNLEELETHRTNPQSDDTDGDDLKDNDEIETHNTDPRSNDSDDDGLTDGDEINTHLSDPNNVDSDEDGLTDGEEINTHQTDPNDTDSDDDTFEDGFEVQAGSLPNDSNSVPDTNLPDPLIYYSFDIEDGTTVQNLGSLETAGETSGAVTYGDGQDASFGTAFVGNRTEMNDAFVRTGFTGDDLGMGAGGTYTAMAWINWAGPDPNASNVDHMVFGQDDGAGNGQQLHHGIRDDSASNIHFGGWGGAQDIADAGVVPADTWTHVAWQYDGTDKVVYVNGEETARAGGNNITTPAFDVIIGAHGRDSNNDPDPGHSFHGSIDEVRIYGEALNLLQIQAAQVPMAGPGARGLEVTDISVDNTENKVTLTFRSRPGRTYSLLWSPDMADGPEYNEIDDGIEAADDGDFTTFDFLIPNNLEGGGLAEKAFFFLRQN